MCGLYVVVSEGYIRKHFLFLGGLIGLWQGTYKQRGEGCRRRDRVYTMQWHTCSSENEKIKQTTNEPSHKEVRKISEDIFIQQVRESKRNYSDSIYRYMRHLYK